jgi:hypothetical protein
VLSVLAFTVAAVALALVVALDIAVLRRAKGRR